ncbi:MAG: DEAD/DEAH box helicase [Cyanobacteria bacterium K_Offshore_surface_m2_239]|nr:DEAD/DEAH box helicase [Cyanobacteria bacterium K_Offshore_surface_m2_239]
MAPKDLPDEPASQHRIDRLAAVLVAAGRVTPALEADGAGGLVARWWPLPASEDRPWLEALLPDEEPASQRHLAEALAAAVDRLVRQRLRASPGALAAPRRSGKGSLAEAWLTALAADDPRLPAPLAATAGSGGERVAAWVREAVAPGGDLRLALRCHEPADGRRRRWTIELLLGPAADPSLLLPLADFWAGATPFPPAAFEGVLRQLGLLTRLAPELAELLRQPAPAQLELAEAGLVSLVSGRAALLAEAGFSLLLPSGLRQVSRLGLRARLPAAKGKRGKAAPAGSGAGLDLSRLFQFEWQAVLGDQPLSQADLEALQRAAELKRPLVRLRGQWTLVDAAAVAGLLRLAGQPAEASGAELLRGGFGLERLGVPAELELAGVEATGPLGALLAGHAHSRAEALPTPAEFMGELRPYQQRGLGWLVFLGQLGLGACLADDMGLGKTAQLIASLLADPLEAPTLVVAPVSLLGNWRRELERFAPGLTQALHHGPERPRTLAALRRSLKALGPGGVLIASYGVLSRDAALLARLDWGRLVFDEAQQLKNPYTAVSRAAAGLRAERRVALTGTPVENRLLELWALLQLLNPGLLGSLAQFRQRFALPIERDRDPEAAERLRRLTAPFLLRRLKSDPAILPDLPSRIEQTELCALSEEQATLYQAVADELLEQAEQSEGIARQGLVLAGLTRLKQVCNHPAHYLDDGSALEGRSGKLNRCEQLLVAILEVGERALIFTQYTAWGERLALHLSRRLGEEVLWLHGGLSRARREELVARFSQPEGPPVFLLSIKAGGTGLNLTAASHVIHYDRWWNPAVEDQATDRAHRLGQRRTVHVHKLMCGGTVEEGIDALIRGKRELATRVVGSGEQALSQLSTEELRQLIQLREPGVER